jgi:hypothetical protein
VLLPHGTWSLQSMRAADLQRAEGELRLRLHVEGLQRQRG